MRNLKIAFARAYELNELLQLMRCYVLIKRFLRRRTFSGAQKNVFCDWIKASHGLGNLKIGFLDNFYIRKPPNIKI